NFRKKDDQVVRALADGLPIQSIEKERGLCALLEVELVCCQVCNCPAPGLKKRKRQLWPRLVEMLLWSTSTDHTEWSTLILVLLTVNVSEKALPYGKRSILML
ncbi:hypothetical protein CVV73_26620, partial [Enterobacter hormaechei]